MIRCKWQGRLGNVLLQCVGLRILSKKFDLSFDYNCSYDFTKLGFLKYSGDKVFYDSIDLDDSQILDFLKMDSFDKGIVYDGLFQLKDFVLTYRNEIKNSFNLVYDDRSSDDVFIHVRLDDASHFNPGYDYYKKCLDNIKFENGYISSDSPDSHLVSRLIDEYGLNLYNNSPIDTICFAKDFKKIILSEGTFSWWIGMLSDAEEIYYPKFSLKPIWHGDIFVYDDWIPVYNN